MTIFKETNKGQGGIPQKVIMVYPSERVEVRLTQAELELLLQQYEKEMHKVSWARVVSSLGIFLGMLLPIVTAQFKSFLWISGDGLKGIFIIVLVASGIFMISYLIRNFYHIFWQKPLDAHKLVENKIMYMRQQLEEELPKLKPTTFGE
jgi:hypothetical protein